MGTAEVATHCPYCALQCGMTLVLQDGAWQVAARDFPTNKGGLCRKGWTAASLLTAPDRLTTPLARPNFATYICQAIEIGWITIIT
jgi:assimilatory nitrate reductase catalytic subunit